MIRTCGILLLTLAAITPARAAAVTVQVEGVGSEQGQVQVQLCDAERFLGDDCPFKTSVPARAGQVAVVFREIPPGRYAAIAYHDANGNGDLDQNAVGMPLEMFGFSNDPPLLMGPPLFKDAAFVVAETDLAVKIRLRR